METRKLVPNKFSTLPNKTKIAFIGEAPGEDEVNTGEPFVGKAGYIFTQALANIGLEREEVFIGNICQDKAPRNNIKSFSTDSFQIQEGLAQLRADLESFQPDLVILMGATALSAFLPWSLEVSRKKQKAELFYDPFTGEGLDQFAAKSQQNILKSWKGLPSISAYRGSFFLSTGHFKGYRCFATYHPSLLNYSYADKWLFFADFQKALARHGEPAPVFRHNSFYTPCTEVRKALISLLLAEPAEVGFDIEGTPETGITCLSFATSSREAIFVGFLDISAGNTRIYERDEELELWSIVSEILYHPKIKKVMHNATYEMFVLAHCYQIYIRNVEDTMILMWCNWSELDKNLGFVSSLCTCVPYYKEERTIPNLDVHAEYNCKDSCVTDECYHVLRSDLEELGPQSVAQYELFMQNLHGVVDMQLRGVAVDIEEVQRQYLFAKKRKERIERAIANVYDIPNFNINSTNKGGHRQTLLYDRLKLKPLTKKDTGATKADKDALYDIARRERKSNRKVYQTCKLLVRAAELSKELGSLNCLYEEDKSGRCLFRSSFACPHSTTGRWNSKISYCKTGRNFQNISTKEKAFVVADPGYLLCQYDLSGADAWTVAAWCAHLGDHTMLRDLENGIKPAKLIRYMIEHGFESFDGLSIEETKKLSKFAPDDKLYVGCKSRLYSSFYQGGLLKALTEIYKKSKGKVSLEMRDLRLIDKVIQTRYYGIQRWQSHVKNLLYQDLPRLVCGSGQTRIVLGNPRDPATLRELLSSEPQANTTHWINLALNRFLYDPINRTANDEIIVIPIISVHDSLITTFKEEDLELAKTIIPTCFSNPIEIAGRQVVCPAEGGCGSTWGIANNAKHPLHRRI